MPIGPRLPSPTGKRKRDNAGDGSSSDSDDSFGPQVPLSKQDDESSAAKKPRVIGPALPPSTNPARESGPVSLEKNDGNSSSESSDDDFGPSLPTKADAKAATPGHDPGIDNVSKSVSNQPNTPQPARDEWMTLAPASGDWSQRIDPTKIKSRKFNTSRTSGNSSSGVDAWHETPEQKQARLRKEVLGIKEDKKRRPEEPSTGPSEEDAETARRMKEYNKQRGPSLFDAHQKSQKGEKDDDPSARAFDREKDIGGGLQLNSTQRRDMMKKSSDFNSRFSSAKYL